LAYIIFLFVARCTPCLGQGFIVEPTHRYAWQRHYEVAILETDRTRLPDLITAAQAAIDARIAQIRAMHDGTPEEHQAIEDARHGLRILIAETQDFQ
jgi:hypothetical protein